MARYLNTKQLERAVVAADRTGRLQWPKLVGLVGSSRGHRGIARLRKVVHAINPHARETRSSVEVDFLALCREEGLPTPAVNVLVQGYLVDFFWPAQRVVVETDTHRYHGDRAAFEADHERTVVLIAAGYDVHRATRQLLQRQPDLFLRNVRQALARRTASNSASPGR
jgi:very-short-patch-repair endonuclease